MMSPSFTRVCTRAHDLKSEVVTARRRRYRGLQGGCNGGMADQDSSCSPGTPRRTKGEEPLLRVLICRPATPPIILQLKSKRWDSDTALLSCGCRRERGIWNSLIFNINRSFSKYFDNLIHKISLKNSQVSSLEVISLQCICRRRNIKYGRAEQSVMWKTEDNMELKR